VCSLHITFRFPPSLSPLPSTCRLIAHTVALSVSALCLSPSSYSHCFFFRFLFAPLSLSLSLSPCSLSSQHGSTSSPAASLCPKQAGGCATLATVLFIWFRLPCETDRYRDILLPFTHLKLPFPPLIFLLLSFSLSLPLLFLCLAITPLHILPPHSCALCTNYATCAIPRPTNALRTILPACTRAWSHTPRRAVGRSRKQRADVFA
jgi:hypothetical protein